MGVSDAIPVLQMGNKSLFGPPQNYVLGGAGFSSLPGQAASAMAEGKSKRDLLWEQKRKQKLDFVNPPILPQQRSEPVNGGFKPVLQ